MRLRYKTWMAKHQYSTVRGFPSCESPFDDHELRLPEREREAQVAEELQDKKDQRHTSERGIGTNVLLSIEPRNDNMKVFDQVWTQTLMATEIELYFLWLAKVFKMDNCKMPSEGLVM